ncbi:Calpain-type cysteine protease DEK1 [Capsicum chinense]|nr:Calpain-type cysteine protease DEK1 [Capsicum chinense]
MGRSLFMCLWVVSQGHKPSMGRSQLICTGGSLMVTVQYSNDYKDDKNEALHTQYIFRTDVPHGGPAFHAAGTVKNMLGALSYATPKLKYLELQVLKKDENINQLTNDLQECKKELGVVKVILQKVFQERDFMWEEVKSYSEMNMLLNYEINMLKRKGSASWTSICWFTCSTSCVFYPVWSDSKGIKLAWGYNISCRDNPWYFGHCISYAVVASVLLGAAVSRHLSVTDPLAARRDALQSTVIRLREGFRRKDQNSSASSSEGCGSSVKRSSSADAGHLGNATVPCTGDGSTWNNIEGINSDKSIDSGRPRVALKAKAVILVPPLLQTNMDLNLALAFQEKLSDPRITSMLERKGRHTDHELANLLQDKGLDPNFAVMLKENGLDPMILALLQRSSLDADREHRDSNPPVTDSNDVEDVLPNHISFSEELRLQGLEKWLQRCRVMLHHVAGTPERAWLLFNLIFILETVIVAIFRPKTIKLLNATYQQFEFGIAVLLLSPVVYSILVFLRSLQAGDFYLPGNLVFKCIIVSVQFSNVG